MSYAEIDGLKMYYEIHGDGDETLILTAGLSGNTESWLEQIPVFSERYRTVVFDNRGAGKTDKPDGEYSTTLFARDLAGLMDVLEIESAHFVGASMGGTIGQNLAIQYPEKVKSLTLACTWEKADNYLFRILESWIDIAANLDTEALLRENSLWVYTPHYFNTNLSTIDENNAAFLKAPQPADAFIRQSRACQTHDASAKVGTIAVPTLVLVGREDILTPPYLSKELHRRIPGSILMVIDGGHVFFWEQADKFNQVVLEFLSQVN